MDCAPAHVLVPLDVERCAIEPLAVVNRLAGRPNLTVTLLHVVNLSVVTAENRLYRELAGDALRVMEEVRREQLSPALRACVKVRLGNPLTEILAEAREANACLIVLPVFPAARWKRLVTAFTPTIAEKLARNGPCPVLVLRAGSTTNRHDRRREECAEPASADHRSWERFLPVPVSSAA